MKKIYIVLFAILYFVVALTSTLHAVEFFGLSNNNWMAIMLACAFEIGQAAVLFALLTSSKDRSKIMPWVLMGIFTLVQVIGNVYASYKYITLNSLDLLVYFKEPIFVWTNLPDDQANVIITYICGGILPICALALTGMVTNYIGDSNENENENKEKTPIIEKEETEQQKEQEESKEKNEDKEEIEENNLEIIQEEQPEEIIEQNEFEQPEIEIPKEIEDIVNGNTIVPEVKFPSPKSQFINIEKGS